MSGSAGAQESPSDRRRRRGPHHWGIRVRAALAGAVILVLALGIAAVLTHIAVERAMLSAAHDAAARQATEIADRLSQPHLDGTDEDGTESDSTESDGGDSDSPEGSPSDAIEDRERLGEALREAGSRGSIVQVVDAGDSVEAAFPEYETTPLTESTDEHQLVVASHSLTLDGRPVEVVVGVSTEVQARTLSELTFLLLIGVPLVGLVGTAAIWWLVGRALRPVRCMAAEVDAITASRLTDRVAVPPTQDELAALATTMNRMLGRLEAADRAQRQFFTDASHELRSPLAGLRTSLEIAAGQQTAGADDAQTAEALRYDALLGETQRLGSLVEDLLTLGKAQEGGWSFQRVDTDLDDVVAGALEAVQGDRNLEFDVHISPVRVTGDPGRLRQIVSNLLSNAVRHANSVVAVRLQSWDSGQAAEADDLTVTDDAAAAIAGVDAGTGVAVLEVDDDGAGIPPQDRDRVFERFVRLDDSRQRDSGGSGLGLHVSREIARAHGGTLTAGLSPEGRTRFTLALPLG
ncbi:HAMP domain-containing sensor histidine kinase [Brevibacterium daeguense]|uniref:histidine kinase n=1 Tax=Brevibacterium daeguense TaxID=909936 RepID=A0ABP8EGB6_9MICO|nr:ATP-binding protein [Brevibacterium daeguense]